MNIDFEIKTLEIAGLRSALEALRLPFGKQCRSNTFFESDFDDDDVELKSTCFIDPRDITLMSNLIKSGDEHAKVLRGIIVYAEINAPRFWWQEADTYRIGSERLSSESTMHIQGKGLSTEELVVMKSELKEGTMQKRIQYFSYQTLRRIYHQRHNHRLPHWHLFCDWIKTLPYANDLIICNLNEEKPKE